VRVQPGMMSRPAVARRSSQGDSAPIVVSAP
jgi:hypothetical protein